MMMVVIMIMMIGGSFHDGCNNDNADTDGCNDDDHSDDGVINL